MTLLSDFILLGFLFIFLMKSDFEITIQIKISLSCVDKHFFTFDNCCDFKFRAAESGYFQNDSDFGFWKFNDSDSNQKTLLHQIRLRPRVQQQKLIQSVFFSK